jgi:hypothetical protein
LFWRVVQILSFAWVRRNEPIDNFLSLTFLKSHHCSYCKFYPFMHTKTISPRVLFHANLRQWCQCWGSPWNLAGKGRPGQRREWGGPKAAEAIGAMLMNASTPRDWLQRKWTTSLAGGSFNRRIRKPDESCNIGCCSPLLYYILREVFLPIISTKWERHLTFLPAHF